MSPEFGEALATFQAANQKELEILVAGGHSRRRAVSSFFLPPPLLSLLRGRHLTSPVLL